MVLQPTAPPSGGARPAPYICRVLGAAPMPTVAGYRACYSGFPALNGCQEKTGLCGSAVAGRKGRRGHRDAAAVRSGGLRGTLARGSTTPSSPHLWARGTELVGTGRDLTDFQPCWVPETPHMPHWPGPLSGARRPGTEVWGAGAVGQSWTRKATLRRNEPTFRRNQRTSDSEMLRFINVLRPLSTDSQSGDEGCFNPTSRW